MLYGIEVFSDLVNLLTQFKDLISCNRPVYFTGLNILNQFFKFVSKRGNPANSILIVVIVHGAKVQNTSLNYSSHLVYSCC
jgi:hypothetical protein